MNNKVWFYHKRNVLLRALFYSLCFILYATQQSHAAGVSLGIYPPVFQIDTTPPSSIKAPLTLENNGEDDITADIQFKLFRPSKDENGTVTYLTGKDAIPSPDSLLFQKVQIFENGHAVTSVTLAPQQQKQLELHIGIDKTAVPADYYFSVVFLARESQDVTNTDTSLDNQNSTVTNGGIATNVLLSIGPKDKPTASIIEFSTPSFLSSGPVPFILRVSNTSKHSIAPTGAIFIKNVFGQYVGKVDILPVAILAKSIRALEDTKSIKDNTPASLYQDTHPGQKPVMLWPETFLLGPYTAGVYVKLSDNGPILTKTLYFFAFPWQAGIGLIIILLIVIIIREKIRTRLQA